MRARIARHRAERPSHWLTVEEPLDLPGACRRLPGHVELAVVDCVTVWVANRLQAGDEDGSILAAADDLAQLLAARTRSWLIVSNEVGEGVHPPTAVGLRFRDVLGQVNQRIAAAVDRVTLMVAGIPVSVKAPREATVPAIPRPPATTLPKLLDAIRRPDPAVGEEAQRRLDQLTKPPGSLGRLEELARRLAEISGRCPPSADQPVIFTLAADHGVAAEGVSAYPQVVTAQMVENFLQGGAAVNVLARHAGARVVVADFGVASPVGERPGLLSRRIGPGTANITRGPAMTREQAERALAAGAELVEDEWARGADLVGTGEMGIANTTAASAVVAALTGLPVQDLTGRGTGIDDAALSRKVIAIERALDVNRPDGGDGVDVLAKVGGFELAGLAGVILAAAAHRLPVILDGFIAGAAALAAVRIAPEARHFLIASHRSVEPGHRHVLEALGLAPYLDLGMRLGEGTGAALCIGLARAAAALFTEMATFKSAGVSERAG
jgi:nicotinate-nucleotide--dimethylbenzimidazole phosphoribosyltransferase